MKRVLLIGSSGMLGSEIALSLIQQSDIQLSVLGRVANPAFDAASPTSSQFALEKTLAKQDFDIIINAVGATKVNIMDASDAEVERVTNVNTVFPKIVADFAEFHNAHLLTVATDCVFSGRLGPYLESASKDPVDLYGVTKSAGEIVRPGVTTLRTSFVGLQQPSSAPMLLEWFLRQPAHAEIQGFRNHLWNGVTTPVLAKIFALMIVEDMLPSGTFHLVPNYQYTKLDLLKEFALVFGRHDLVIRPSDGPENVDRRLGTEFPQMNLKLWGLLGHVPPTDIRASIVELAERRPSESN